MIKEKHNFMLYNLGPLTSTKLKREDITSTVDSLPVITPNYCPISLPKHNQYPDFKQHRLHLSMFEFYKEITKQCAIIYVWLLSFHIRRLIYAVLFSCN